jgi:hypothetical protein
LLVFLSVPEKELLVRKKPFNKLIPNQKMTSAHHPQEAVEEPRPHTIGTARVVARLWELATLSHQATRNSISGQIKALSMIVAIEGLVPDRRAAQKPAPTATGANIYKAPWLVKAEAKAAAEAAGFEVIERQDTSPSAEPPEDGTAVNPTPSPAPVGGKSAPAQPTWAPSKYESFVPDASYR